MKSNGFLRNKFFKKYWDEYLRIFDLNILEIRECEKLKVI